MSEPGSYATGKVRVECISGLKRLGGLRGAGWARRAADAGFYPTPHMVHLVDKKFGGELTKVGWLGA